jgi:hypothetical protein
MIYFMMSSPLDIYTHSSFPRRSFQKADFLSISPNFLWVSLGVLSWSCTKTRSGEVAEAQLKVRGAQDVGPMAPAPLLIREG